MKKFFLFLSIFFAQLYFINPVQAICPVCTVAVGAGVGLSRWLGIDDTITGVWVGGLTVSLIIWTIEWLKKKKIDFSYRSFLVSLGYILLVIAPLHYGEIIGHPYNKLWGVDKLIIGIIAGSIIFLVSNWFYEIMKKHNGNRAYFPMQKVAMPLLFLSFVSLFFYLITR